ncbi:hypothetical protein DOY81_012278 [Sarcophaga bullata]|nr:hypothetical protein DOY81_012278 [Sarcophaga bullata]
MRITSQRIQEKTTEIGCISFKNLLKIEIKRVQNLKVSLICTSTEIKNTFIALQLTKKQYFVKRKRCPKTN